MAEWERDLRAAIEARARKAQPAAGADGRRWPLRATDDHRGPARQGRFERVELPPDASEPPPP